MNVTCLAISIGNTNTKVGAFAAGKLVHTQAVDNGRPAELTAALQAAHAALDGDAKAPVVLASVNPPLTQRCLDALGQALPGLRVLRVERDLNVPIGRQLDPETIVGEDRLLNAAAAYDVLKQAVVVVDAGTAVTIDFVDGAGTFHGGAILPGPQMMLKSLHEHTAQLPEVTMARPTEPIGHNTIEAMRSAAFYGIRGAVRELHEQYAEVAGAYPMLIATGGGAALLFEGYELVERIVPDLTLIGLAVTLQKYVDDGDEA